MIRKDTEHFMHEEGRSGANPAELYAAETASARESRFRDLAAPLVAAHPAEALRWYSAPGRTELGGNHTDHNRGKVLCAAVHLDILAAVAPRADRRVRIISAGYPDPFELDLASLEPHSEERGTTASLVRGVAAFLAEQGVEPRGFEARFHSRVLPGSGLSSSAAVEVLLGTILADLAGAEVPPVELARIGQAAENRYFGKPCGLMDQMASAVGGIVAIDFRDTERPRIDRIDFDFADSGYALAVVNTGGSHADLTPDYAAIPREMRAVAALLGGRELRDVDSALLYERGPEIRRELGDRAFLRALHFATECGRVDEMVDALEGDRLEKFLKLARRSGDSSWRFLQNLSPPSNPREQGLCAAIALSEDFLGKEGVARVHGGGFAGTIQAYLPERLMKGYSDLMERHFGPGAVIPLSIRKTGACRVRTSH